MKVAYFPILLLLSFYTIACGGHSGMSNNDIDSSLIAKAQKINLQKGKIIDPVICQSDPTKSYALYIPEDSSNKPLPVVYFFDAHGDGLLPVKKYKAIADSFHFILAGSNDSKNGNDWNQAESIWNTMNDDLQKRIAIDGERIYTGGFSGGAKVATFIALHHNEISGVIANGAGLEDITTAGNLNFSFTAITGTGDLNMTDLVSIDKILDKSGSRHRIIFFNGIHEWAPESTMLIAFEGLQFDAMQKKSIPVNTAFVQHFANSSKKEIAGDLKDNLYLEAAQKCSLVTSMLDGVSDESAWFHEKENSIIHTTAYQKQDAAKRKHFTKRRKYQSRFPATFSK